MSPKVSAEIIARADGIPLFVEELSKAVMESGLADVDGDDAAVRGAPPAGVVPATLHDSLMARLDRMSLVKPVAQFAAVLGRVFTVQLLSAAAPRHWLPIDSGNHRSRLGRNHPARSARRKPHLSVQACPAAGRRLPVAAEGDAGAPITRGSLM